MKPPRFRIAEACINCIHGYWKDEIGVCRKFFDENEEFNEEIDDVAGIGLSPNYVCDAHELIEREDKEEEILEKTGVKLQGRAID
ncbi:MAG: hypothetical protein ACFFCS_26095 [Candidatus Hodarchaeota archaeon]